jgi:putative Holliday junction resolvase
MRKLAVDVGQSRIGLAISEGSLVLPLEVISASESAASEVLQIARDRQVAGIYIGLPLALSGSYTQSTHKAVEFARDLGEDFPVRLIDERLTTKSAQSRLRESGKDSKQSRGIVDAQAAALILEFALQSERVDQLAGKAIGDLDD